MATQYVTHGELAEVLGRMERRFDALEAGLQQLQQEMGNAEARLQQEMGNLEVRLQEETRRMVREQPDRPIEAIVHGQSPNY